MIWPAKKLRYRAVHNAMKASVAFTPFPVPELYSGPGCVKKVPEAVKSKRIDNVLVVTDKDLMALGLLDGLLKSLEEEEIRYTLFDEVYPNPTIQNVEDGYALYRDNKCKGIIAFGGGSPMDCAKIIAARVKRPRRSVKKLKGLFKILRILPPIFAVPTTAGTGSETTIAAVISDPEEQEKFAIIDFSIVPRFAFLDPELMVSLPQHITSTTGMDALTHAVESYIGLHNTELVKNNAEKATRLIFENLEDVYEDGSDIVKRENMAMASYYAGVAFTRASVGYVHAIAHNLGGLYGVPHGLANAIILPYVLEESREDAEKKIANLAIEAKLGKHGDSPTELSISFIERIKAMNKNMGIPDFVEELQEEDIPLIAKRALKEANPLYPVPTILNQKSCEKLISRLLQ